MIYISSGKWSARSSYSNKVINTWCTEDADPLGDILSMKYWYDTGNYPSDEVVERLKEKWLAREKERQGGEV